MPCRVKLPEYRLPARLPHFTPEETARLGAMSFADCAAELAIHFVGDATLRGYLADVEVFHPRTTIERHAEGWKLTGRNRVWIARRTLPWPIAIVHVTTWLVLGALRAPRGEARRSYLAGWWSGWSADIDRRPIRWRTVWRLTRLGRPPII